MMSIFRFKLSLLNKFHSHLRNYPIISIFGFSLNAIVTYFTSYQKSKFSEINVNKTWTFDKYYVWNSQKSRYILSNESNLWR